jgi:hypothetical protein
MKSKNYYTERTVPKYNSKIGETEEKLILLTHIYMTGPSLMQALM